MSEEAGAGEGGTSVVLYAGMGIFIVLTAVIALMLAVPFEETGIKAFENPESMWNPVYFFIIILGITAFILIVLKFGGDKLVYIVMLGAVAATMYYVMDGLLLYYQHHQVGIGIPVFVFGTWEWNAGALGITAILTFLLYKYPEWYVLDVTGLMIGSGAAAIFGISLVPEVVIMLMIILIVYDAISVYKTKHMVSLAESVVDLRVPILFVLPRKRDFSIMKGCELGDAFLMGLGDAVIPTMLVVSAYMRYYIEGGGNAMPALGALAGTLVGYTVLTRFAGKGRPHAGLPFLNTGAIIGFIIGLLATHTYTYWM